MKRSHIFLVAVVAAAPMLCAAPLTLDPAVIEEAKRAVFGGESVMTQDSAPAPAAAEQGDTALWQEAMDAAGTEMMPVLLLALLQRLNPHLPMQEHAARYADRAVYAYASRQTWRWLCRIRCGCIYHR